MRDRRDESVVVLCIKHVLGETLSNDIYSNAARSPEERKSLED